MDLVTRCMTNVRHAFPVVLTILLQVVAGCAREQRATPTRRDEGHPVQQPESVKGKGATPAKHDQGTAIQQSKSIGMAWLEQDGTLVLQLRAEGRGRIMGDGLIKYQPDHEAYGRTLSHIGGLKKGQVKPVPPWPDVEPKR